MKSSIKACLLAGALALAPFLSTAATVLWFSVSGFAPLRDGGEEISTVADYRDANGNAINAVRVAVSGEGIAPGTFLSLYYEDEHGWTLLPPAYIAELQNGAVAWQPADMGENPAPGTMVRLELGYIDFENENSEFVTIASTEELFSNLDSGGYTSIGGLKPQTQTPWSPEFYDITPEPSAGILIALGTVLLALRRRPA